MVVLPFKISSVKMAAEHDKELIDELTFDPPINP